MTGHILPDSTRFSVQTKGRRYSFLRPSDPDGILDQMTDEEYEKDRLLPYWTEYWPSSEALLDFLQTVRLPQDACIAEAGCGLGVLSAWLISRGYRAVPFDISEAACRYARENMRQFCPRATALCTDWRALPFRAHTFDHLIAADVLYEARWVHPVLSMCDRYLKRGGYALLADPCRKHWKDVKNLAAEYGFAIEVAAEKKLNSQKTTVEILKMTKP
ncbi:MAG: class I SAM-dependent methyltransferase [Chitinivibrionales bacterium]